MKYIKYLLVIISIVLITGCNHNSSPEAVAKEMAKRLSNGNYKKMEQLILMPKNSLIDEDIFKQYLDYAGINIEGNKTIEILKNNSSYSNIVKIKIDNNRILEVNTLKKDGKWYIDLGNYIAKYVQLSVPKDSIVKINNKELSKKYKSNTGEKVESVCDTCSYNLKFSYETDTYEIPSMLVSNYEFSIETNNAKYTFESTPRSLNNKKIMLVATDEYKKKVETALKNNIQKIYNEIEYGNNFDLYKQYYYDGIWNQVEPMFNQIKPKVESSVANYTRENIKLDTLVINNCYVMGNNVVVDGELKYTYKENKKYKSSYSFMGETSNNYSDKMKFSIVVEETSKNNFVVTSGYNVTFINKF